MSVLKAPTSVGLRRLWNRTLDLLLPPRCVGCGREGAFLCATCLAALPRLEPPCCAVCAEPTSGQLCPRCQEGPLPVDGVRAPFRMDGAVRKAVHALKYRNLRALAPALAVLMAQHLEATSVPGDALAPVPLHRKRLRERGYNQAELLAAGVGVLTGLPVLEGALVRTRPSAPQVALPSREARALNVQGAFRCTLKVEGLAIILVDDVVTTASTVNACAVALKERGAASVWALALAREV